MEFQTNRKNHLILSKVLESGDFKLQGDAIEAVSEAFKWFEGLSSTMALLDEKERQAAEAAEKEGAEEQKQLPPPPKQLPAPTKVEPIDNSDSKHKKVNGGHKKKTKKRNT